LATIVTQNVTVEFPIYGSEKSFRKVLFRRATGGLIRREGPQYNRVIVRALENINLRLENGDRLGIMGHNGAGKSTLLRILAGVYAPTAGHVTIVGRVSPLFNIAPGLDLDDTGYENILTCGLFLGMSRQEIAQKTPDIERFSELGEYLTLPVRTYSTGMLVRLTFAIATTIDPEILILDEGLGAGDARFAKRAKQRVDALIDRSSILVIASHSDTFIQEMCNKAILLHGGRIVAEGRVDTVIDSYKRLNQATDAAPTDSVGRVYQEAGAG